MTRPRKTKPRAVPEKTEQSHIVQLLSSVGAKVWVTGVPRRRGDFQGAMRTPGLPDVIAFLPVESGLHTRRLLFVEVKKRGGVLRPEQEVFRSLCIAGDIDHIVGGLDIVISWLVKYGYAKADGFAHYRPIGGQHARGI